jgi:prepilin-type processing-associated H-X9-DG protein
MTNANGTSNTAMLALSFLAPKTYGTVDANWSNAPNSVSTATQAQDNNSGSGPMGGPHPNTDPTLFADGHVQNIAFQWANSNPGGTNMWNWQNTTPFTLP